MKKQKISYQQQLIKREKPKPSGAILWQNIQGDNCKKIIGPNRCFCKHPFQHHKKVRQKYVCQVENCNCDCYEYVPFFDMKCLCKHSYKQHDKLSRKCRLCRNCFGFITSWCCKCGFKFQQHKNIPLQEKQNILPPINQPTQSNHKRFILNRVNKKYGELNENQSLRIPDEVTPLDLFIKPHNYRFTSADWLLRMRNNAVYN